MCGWDVYIFNMDGLRTSQTPHMGGDSCGFIQNLKGNCGFISPRKGNNTQIMIKKDIVDFLFHLC